MTEPIQRWGLAEQGQMFSVYGAEGEWVRYDDHLAAYEDVKKRAYLHGLDAAREAVSNITDRQDHWIGECVMSKAIDGQYINFDDALAAIDSLKETS